MRKEERITKLEDVVFGRTGSYTLYGRNFPFVQERGFDDRLKNLEKQNTRLALLLEHLGLEYFEESVLTDNSSNKKVGYRKIKKATK